MKKIFAALTLFLVMGFVSKAQETVAPNADPNAPELKFDSDVIDYGTVDYDANGVREFKFRNAGKSPLTITNVQGQCGCTATTIDGKPGWPQEPIAPGKTGIIKVKYDTKRPGRFEKNVTVTSNSKQASMVVKIKGEVKPAPVANDK